MPRQQRSARSASNRAPGIRLLSYYAASCAFGQVYQERSDIQLDFFDLHLSRRHFRQGVIDYLAYNLFGTVEAVER
jgi:hypothetical protein